MNLEDIKHCATKNPHYSHRDEILWLIEQLEGLKATNQVEQLAKVVNLYRSRYEEDACPGCHSASQCESDCWILSLMDRVAS